MNSLKSPTQKDGPAWRRWLPCAYLIVLLFFAFSQWFIKVNDNDFWWHIATGQYILEHKDLPDKDPFTFTFIEHDRDMPERPAAILKSYWLSQIILYLVYLYSGPMGTIIFKILIFALILMILWKYLINRSASLILTFLMLAGFVVFSKEYMTERPQIFSFLFAAIVFYLLEKTRTSKLKADARFRTEAEGEIVNAGKMFLNLDLNLLLLPVVMLLWSNMHGGYLVGIAFITIYAAGLLFKPSKTSVIDMQPPTRYPLHASRYFRLAVYLFSILVTLANPVTYHTLITFASFSGSVLEKDTLEFISPFKVMGSLNANWYPLFGLLALGLAALVVSLISALRKKGDALPHEHSALLIGTAVASLNSLRYGMFFMIVAIPIVTRYLSRRFGVNADQRPKGIITPLLPSLTLREGEAKPGGVILRKRSYENIAAMAFSVLLLIFSCRSPLFTAPTGSLIDQTFMPVNAVDFIEQKLPQQNIYNDINWGGYLIWKLYPNYRVFSDTRYLNIKIFRQYKSILYANETMHAGLPEWKTLLDMYSINTIVHSTINPYSGEIYPLMLKLLRDTEWHLVYTDGVAAVFVRKMSPDFFDFPKDQLLKEMHWEVTRGLQRFPGHPGFLRTLNMLKTMK